MYLFIWVFLGRRKGAGHLGLLLALHLGIISGGTYGIIWDAKFRIWIGYIILLLWVNILFMLYVCVCMCIHVHVRDGTQTMQSLVFTWILSQSYISCSIFPISLTFMSVTNISDSIIFFSQISLHWLYFVRDFRMNQSSKSSGIVPNRSCVEVDGGSPPGEWRGLWLALAPALAVVGPRPCLKAVSLPVNSVVCPEPSGKRCCALNSRKQHVLLLQREPWLWNFLMLENSWLWEWCVSRLEEFSNHKWASREIMPDCPCRFSVSRLEQVCLVLIVERGKETDSRLHGVGLCHERL